MNAPLQQQARALGDPTRHAIFRYLADAGSPVDVQELNGEFPLNHNAIRQHLARLVDAGLVLESTAHRPRRGRPRLVYEVNAAVEGQWGTTGPYERLSVLLVEIIRSGHRPEDVGRRAADQFRVASPSGDDVADLHTAMVRQGFDPDVRRTRAGAEIVLRHCPFATAALADRPTVCALHLGIVEGLLDGGATLVHELIANDPRRANCKLRLRTPKYGEATAATEPGVLTIRKRRAR